MMSMSIPFYSTSRYRIQIAIKNNSPFSGNLKLHALLSGRSQADLLGARTRRILAVGSAEALPMRARLQ